MDAETFNRLYPIGTPVRAFPETRAERPRITRTRTLARDVRHGLTVVHVDGLRGALTLAGIDPLPDNQPVEAS
ncbi:hypothetical protein [Streptomyces lancefieldiae]|uniref:Uncharacterized protein n=1 Tax=Streptomyces lancefieldiae TaxID=3075520 RepID=A0ABU3AFR5_9ACTN|nr:hypothetical protein [Streptomyces sp. DSM 40712]MDT0608778.1 hypothetical protein [Streptomyces sp. DSM 40712]